MSTQTTGSRKLQYQTPQLRVHGDIQDVTAGSLSGSRLDAHFYKGTSIDDLTFS